MDIHFSIKQKKQYIQIDLNGTITKQDLLDATGQLVKTPGYHHGKSVIWEVSQADLSNLDLDALDQAAKGIHSIFKGQRIGHTALVSEKSINVVTVELFKEIYNRDVVAVFDSFVEAEDWILSSGQEP